VGTGLGVGFWLGWQAANKLIEVSAIANARTRFWNCCEKSDIVSFTANDSSAHIRAQGSIDRAAA
jgi:hypothetical protein